MRPESFNAFHEAIRFGAGHCPPDLFDGSVPAIVRGLKVHANNIAHARHVALEETYPRLLRAMDPGAFHEAAEQFLDQPHVVSLSLDALGEGFERYLEEASFRDLARAEWRWLETFHAAEAEALTVAELASLQPDALLAARLRLHPATRWLVLEEPEAFDWDWQIAGDGEVLLLSRPDAEVLLRRVDAEAASILSALSKPRPVVRLLGADLPALITLIDAGTIVLESVRED